MTMLADRVDAVIGVDTHTDTHTAAICDARGAVLAEITVGTDEEGFGQLLDAALKHAPGERLAWALEGTGSYGAGLAKALREIDQEVIEGTDRQTSPRAGQERHQRRGCDRPHLLGPDAPRPAPARAGPRSAAADHHVPQRRRQDPHPADQHVQGHRADRTHPGP